MNHRIYSVLAIISAMVLSVEGLGQNQPAQPSPQTPQPGQRQGQQNESLPDYEPGASVILTGSVASIENEQFILDYGEDQVRVDLADWDWSDELRSRLSEGQQVTVSGTVDDDWFEKRQIDADNIYVATDYAYYYIVDQNPAYEAQQRSRETQEDATFMSTRGQVTEISGNRLTVESQGNEIRVDLSELGYDPVDPEGGQQVQEGDRIYVFGDIGEEYFDTGIMRAESLITLSEAGQSRSGMNQQNPRPGRLLPEQELLPPSQRGSQQGGRAIPRQDQDRNLERPDVQRQNRPLPRLDQNDRRPDVLRPQQDQRITPPRSEELRPRRQEQRDIQRPEIQQPEIQREPQRDERNRRPGVEPRDRSLRPPDQQNRRQDQQDLRPPVQQRTRPRTQAPRLE